MNDKQHTKPDLAHHQQNPQNQDPKKHIQNPNDPQNRQNKPKYHQEQEKGQQ